jgi:hypothetical protein
MDELADAPGVINAAVTSVERSAPFRYFSGRPTLKSRASSFALALQPLIEPIRK